MLLLTRQTCYPGRGRRAVRHARPGPAASGRAVRRVPAGRVLADRAEELAHTESRQTGKPIRLATRFDVPGTIDNVAFFAGAARNLKGKAAGEYSGDHTSNDAPRANRRGRARSRRGTTRCRWPPGRCCPAIAAGNTIVLKPAEITPLTSLMLAEARTEAGIPDGVVNVVAAPGRWRRGLMAHPDVDMVSFTGSTRSARRVMAWPAGHRSSGSTSSSAARRRSSSSTTPTSTPRSRARWPVALINTGQDCTAATRAYVQRSLYDAFVAGRRRR